LDATKQSYGETPAFDRAFVRDLLSILDEEEVEDLIRSLQAAGADFS
jgi:hypothetical protein